MKWALMLALAAVLAIAAGCQAVSGLDLNGVLKNSLKVKSYEGKSGIGFELMVKDGALDDADPEEAAIISLVSKVKVNLTDIKIKDENNASYAGTLSLGDTSIGFSLRTDSKLTVLNIEGLQKPIELDMTASALNSLMEGSGLDAAPAPSAEADADMQAEVREIADSLIDIVGGYAIDNLPNPTRLTVNPVTDTVGSESVSLMKVHADISGKELWQWAGAYLDALVADKDGLKKTLTGVIDLFEQHPDLWDEAGLDNPFADFPAAGEERDKQIQEGVDSFIADLAEMKTEYDSADADTIDGFFNEQSYIKADLFVDSKLNIRKQDMEFSFAPSPDAVENADLGYEAEDAASVIEGFKVTYSRESWNMNGAVTPDAPQHTGSALTLDQLMDMEGYQFLRQTDAKSPLYDLLKNKLHAGRQSITLDPYYDDYPPIVTPDGRTLVPLRDVAEQLGATVAAGAGKSIRLYDDGTHRTIEMKPGSAYVKINGSSFKWSYPVMRLSSGVTYVPAKDLVQALRGTVKWQESDYGDGEKVFVIEREIA